MPKYPARNGPQPFVETGPTWQHVEAAADTQDIGDWQLEAEQDCPFEIPTKRTTPKTPMAHCRMFIVPTPPTGNSGVHKLGCSARSKTSESPPLIQRKEQRRTPNMWYRSAVPMNSGLG